MVETSIIVIDRPLIQVRHISDRIELSSLPSLGNLPMTKEKKPGKGSKAHPKKKNFSSFNTKEAYQQLKIKTLLHWDHVVMHLRATSSKNAWPDSSVTLTSKPLRTRRSS
jgi:hypothetical protein